MSIWLNSKLTWSHTQESISLWRHMHPSSLQKRLSTNKIQSMKSQGIVKFLRLHFQLAHNVVSTSTQRSLDVLYRLGFSIVIIKNTGVEAFCFFPLLTVRARVRKSICFAYFLIMWFKIGPISRGEYGNVTKKFANCNLPFIYNKRKFDNKAKTIHCQTSVFCNNYDYSEIYL